MAERSAGQPGWRAASSPVQPRLLVGVILMVGGLVWAVARGALTFYGLTPVDLYHDLDQSPLLLTLVGAWLSYRSRLR